MKFKEDLVGQKGFRAQGFIGAYMHTGGLEFVKVGDEPNQGYYRIPQENVLRQMHVKNLIVNKASEFMAKRMRPGTSWGAGIGFLEVGTGYGTGSPSAPQAESIGQTTLRQPLARKAISSWTYLDSSGNPTASETNILQLTTNFAKEEAVNGTVGSIVEMGLFGGDATEALGSGYMFNYKVFPVWSKTNEMELTVVWILTF